MGLYVRVMVFVCVCGTLVCVSKCPCVGYYFVAKDQEIKKR